jgi:hypothetical protein
MLIFSGVLAKADGVYTTGGLAGGFYVSWLAVDEEVIIGPNGSVSFGFGSPANVSGEWNAIEFIPQADLSRVLPAGSMISGGSVTFANAQGNVKGDGVGSFQFQGGSLDFIGPCAATNGPTTASSSAGVVFQYATPCSVAGVGLQLEVSGAADLHYRPGPFPTTEGFYEQDANMTPSVDYTLTLDYTTLPEPAFFWSSGLGLAAMIPFAVMRRKRCS